MPVAEALHMTAHCCSVGKFKGQKHTSAATYWNAVSVVWGRLAHWCIAVAVEVCFASHLPFTFLFQKGGDAGPGASLSGT